MKRAHQVTIGTLFQWGTIWNSDCPLAKNAFCREFSGDLVYRKMTSDMYGRTIKANEWIEGFRLFYSH